MDSNTVLGVIFSIVQNWPIIKAVCTKLPEFFFFCIFYNILIIQSENKETISLLFWILKLKQLIIIGQFWIFSFQLSNLYYCP